MLEVWLLGKFEVRLDGVVVQLSSRPEQSLLAFLLLNAGTAYRREKLAGLIWPDADESNAKGYLRLALWHIRRALKDASAHAPDYFKADKLNIAFNSELEHWVDAAVLKKGDAKSIQSLLEATSVYQGELLPGFYDEWAALERESVQAIYERKMSTLLERLLSERCWQETIEQAERWISMGTTPEQAYRGLMIANAGLGQISAAIAAYQRCVDALKKDLDVEPSDETRRLFEKLCSGQQIFPVGASHSVRGFELRSVIGEGVYGTVYRAFQKSVGREVAIKVIRPQYANNPEFIRRFEVEAHIVARLEHPHIVPLYDYWREPDEGYLVMRLLKGGNLETLLESGPVEIGLAVELVDQIAAALATAHRQGVVHGGIKPANILLDEAGNAYLSDFGIAKLVDGDGHPRCDGEFYRTDDYLSPEQIQNQPVTPQSDIYSFGIILYQILTGKKPFPDKEQKARIENHLTRSLPSMCGDRPDLPEAVDAVLRRAAALDPADRFEDALALAAAFRLALVDSSKPPLVNMAPLISIVNPYKDLRAFQEADAADFFGKEELTQRLVACLSEN
ncbi:MAG: protein kinase domain-containing protein, partial [Anaerolineales bacterium]